MIKELLKDISRALDEAGIAYTVIGGQAVLRYGRTRVEDDIDLRLTAPVEAVAVVVTWPRGFPDMQTSRG